MRVLDPARIPRGIRLRVQLCDVPSGWALAKWGAPHHREQHSEYWAFELASGAVAAIEYVADGATMVIRSDSEDTEMLRDELDVRALASSDFVHALMANDIRELAAEFSASGKSLEEAFVAFEGRGSDLWVLFDALASAYGASLEDVRDVWARQYAASSPFELRAKPIRPGSGT